MEVSTLLFWKQLIVWLCNIMFLRHILHSMNMYTPSCAIFLKIKTKDLNSPRNKLLIFIDYWLKNTEEYFHLRNPGNINFSENLQHRIWKVTQKPRWSIPNIWNKAQLDFKKSSLNWRMKGPRNPFWIKDTKKAEFSHFWHENILAKNEVWMLSKDTDRWFKTSSIAIRIKN